MGPQRRGIYVNGAQGNAELQHNVASARAGMKLGETLQEYAERRPEIVRDGVEKIIRRLQGVDAFDVLELLRNREVMAPRLGVVEAESSGNPKTLEIVATALLARGARVIGPAPRDDAAQRATEMLHIVGARMGEIGTFSNLSRAHKADDPWARLAAGFRLARLSIRNLHFRSIDDDVNRRLFGSGNFAKALAEKLGFTWDDFQGVRGAVFEDYSDDLYGAFDQLAELATEARSLRDSGDAPDVKQLAKGRAVLESLITQPGPRGSFTVEDIAERSNLSKGVVSSILDLFSVPFEAADPVIAVEAYLDGANPFAEAALIRDADGNYLQLALEIGDDNYRQIIERSLGRDAIAVLYNEHRREISEATVGEYLGRILGVTPLASCYYYYAEREGFAPNDLGPSAPKPTAVGKECEGDLLFVVDDVAFCVEVKGSSVSPAARSTRDDFFRNEINKTIGAGAAQARRIAGLIRINGGYWQRDRTWLDLSHVREVRTIVVTLDDLGPLSSEAADLDAAGVMPLADPSWVVSVFDLAIIADLIDDPAQFLLYLRRRTDPESAARWRALDELDLVMLFFQTALPHQPDPQSVAREFPKAPALGADERLLSEEQVIDSRVGDYTTEMLNPWYEFRQGEGPLADKPHLSLDPNEAKLIRDVRTSGNFGATVAAADLLGLTVVQRLEFERLIQLMGAAAKSGRLETGRISLAGSSGAGALVIGSAPRGASAASITDSLRSEVETVLVEWGCDRVVGLAVDRTGSTAAIGYQSLTVPASFSSRRVPPIPPSAQGRKGAGAKRRR